MGAGEVRPGEIATREVDAGEVFARQVGADEVAVEIDSIIVAEAGCERGKTRQRLWRIELVDFGWVRLCRASGRLPFSGLPLIAPVGRWWRS